MAPEAAAYSDANTQTKNQALQTGQSAGLGSQLAANARAKAAGMSQASAATAGTIADARRSDTLAKANLMPIPGQMANNNAQTSLANASSRQGTIASQQNAAGLYSGAAGIGNQQQQNQLSAQNMSLTPASLYGQVFGTTVTGMGNANSGLVNLAGQNPYPGATAIMSGLGTLGV